MVQKFLDAIRKDPKAKELIKAMPAPKSDAEAVEGYVKLAKDLGFDLTIDETPGAFTFRVGNNGPAIPPQLRRSIFQLGFTTKSDGHGSGLSIVEEIVKDHGGQIRVESDEEHTVFIGSIPKKGTE